MCIRKLLITLHAITTLAMTAALTFPCVAQAVSIGDVVLQSRLGEPLLARVGLMVGRNERIEGSCLSLTAPDPRQEDSSNFLTEANLSLKTEGKRQYVNISSPKPFNDAFARLRLQVKCPGTRSITKTLTILPSAQTAGKKLVHPVSFRPKLSGEPIDESRTGKISAEKNAALLAQRKQLEASFLAIQNQLKQLENGLGEIKLQLTQLDASPSTAVSSAPVPLSANVPSAIQSVTVDTRPPPTSVIPIKQPVMQQDNQEDNPDMPKGLFAALILGLAIIYYKIKSRNGAKLLQDAKPILKPADDAGTAPKMAMPRIAKPPSQVQPSQVKSEHAPAAAVPPKASAARNTAVPVSQLPSQKIGEEMTGEDSILEEAELYVANGRLSKAVEILLEIIKRCPSKADAWTLLLSIYSSLGKAAEFESAAREFLRHHKASPSWSGIQVLGRTLDHDNPLYADHSSHISASPLLSDAQNLHRSIGDILMEMRVLSKREILKYLDDFDPKKHGRFGGYLVARKAITLAQLDQALLQQQGVHAEIKPVALPSLQDIENFLTDFDPRRHGSVGKFMVSRNAVTPEQLSQLLHQQSSRGVADEPLQADDPVHLNKGSTLAFALESTP